MRLSQKRLGEEIGAFGGEISWWEARKSRPSRAQLSRIFDFFDVTEDPDPAALPPVDDDPDEDATMHTDTGCPDDPSLGADASTDDASTDDAPSNDDVEGDDEEDGDDRAGSTRVEPAGATRGSRHPLALPIPEREELCRLYLEQKMSIKNIGAHYGVSSRTARKWLKRSKVPLRSLSEQMRHSAHRGPVAEESPRRRRTASTSSAPTVRRRRREPEVDATPEPEPQPPSLERSVRVRRRDDETPRQQRPEYDVDETGRVYRIDVAEPDDELDELDDASEPAATSDDAADDDTAARAMDDAVAAAAAALLGTDEDSSGPAVVRRAPSAARNRVGDSRVRVADFSDEVLERPRIRQANARRVRMVSARPTGRPTSTRTTFDTPQRPTTTANATAVVDPATPAVTSTPSASYASSDPIVARHVDGGYSVPELALSEGVSVAEIRERLLDAGVAVRSWREPLEVRRGGELPPRDALARQLQLGVQLEDLADSYEVSLARVRGWLDHFHLVPETGTRVDRFDRVDGASAAVVAIADGAHHVVADTDMAIAMAAYSWSVDAAGRPCTRLAGCAIPLAHMVLGIEPGERDLEVEHGNGDLLDCRKANLRRL